MSKCSCMSVAYIERLIDEEIYRQTNGTMGKRPRLEPNPKALAPKALALNRRAPLGPLLPRRLP